MATFTDDQIVEMFLYHPPTEEKRRAYAEINSAAAGFMTAVQEWVPEGADRDKAVTSLRVARMWANSAIALEGKVGWPLYPRPLPGE